MRIAGHVGACVYVGVWACLRVCSLLNENAKTRLAALQMLVRAAGDPHDGGVAVMDAFHVLSVTAREPTRFYTLMRLLTVRTPPPTRAGAAVLRTVFAAGVVHPL